MGHEKYKMYSLHGLMGGSTVYKSSKLESQAISNSPIFLIVHS